MTLADHAKTLASYLNQYKVALPSDQRHYARRFFSYLLTTCWRKMYRRITSWPAIGFIGKLSTLMLSGDLQRAIQHHCWKDPPNNRGLGDRTLVKALYDAQNSFPIIMDNVSPKFRSLECLTSALDSIPDGSWAYEVYNQRTAFQFHCLLVAVFIGHARSLARLKKFYEEV